MCAEFACIPFWQGAHAVTCGMYVSSAIANPRHVYVQLDEPAGLIV